MITVKIIYKSGKTELTNMLLRDYAKALVSLTAEGCLVSLGIVA